MQSYVKRKNYIDKLLKWKDTQLIKVITGVRRSGKSVLLQQYIEELLKQGISREQIVFVNLESLDYIEIQDYMALYEYLKLKLVTDKMTYFFLDEVQNIPDFQKAVDSLYMLPNTDIYITGSNAYLLSGELATLLSGRYIELNILPFSMQELSELYTYSPEQLFQQYLLYGGFPYLTGLPNLEARAYEYFDGIYNTIIIKDIEERSKRRETDSNKRKITDISLLRNIARFLADSIGNPISTKRIADYITSSGRKISQNTVGDYVSALVEPFVFYPVERYDITGKQLLKTQPKYYIVDLGLAKHLVKRSRYDLGFNLENIIYLELLRRDYKVYVGKVQDKEIDFLAEKGQERIYIQVCASMMEESTFNREMAPLKLVKDNYPKYIMTLDRFVLGNYEGINVINAIDWLLEN